jgi:hypothetical protein
MYLVVLFSPLGTALSLWYADWKGGFSMYDAAIRAVIAILASIGCSVAIGLCDTNPFMTTKGWVLIPVITPLPAVLLSGAMWKAK